MFEHSQYSRDLKIQKLQYSRGEVVDQALIDAYTNRLAKADLSILKTDAEKIAFWVNIYNGMTNQLVIKKRIKKSMLESPFLVMCTKFVVGGMKFTLDDIEHGILRANRKSKYKFRKQFRGKDKRLALVVAQMDNRIHFALNCGAKSCPAIASYSAQYLNRELQLAEESFAAQEFLVDKEQKKISCSRIYWLYKVDFPNTYLNDPKYKDYKVKYRKYDFSVS